MRLFVVVVLFFFVVVVLFFLFFCFVAGLSDTTREGRKIQFFH